MKEYHKIQTIFKRQSEKPCKIIEGEYSLPEFEYLKDNIWTFTEKVDGTNIRIMLETNLHPYGQSSLKIGGKTDNASIPSFLYDKLNEIFDADKLAEQFHDGVCLYGEGYGAKIQKGGGNYISDGVDFVLFDVKVGEYWLNRKDVDDIANKLNIKSVPIIGEGTLQDAVEICRKGFKSQWGDFESEGIVARPKNELFRRNGERIITKIKCKDFR